MIVRFWPQGEVAPFHPSAGEQAQRFQAQAAQRESCHSRLGPGRRGKLWKWLARSGLLLFARAEYIQRICAAAKYLDSIRQRPARFSFSPYERSDKARVGLRAPRRASIRRHRQAVREGNRPLERRWQCCLRESRDSDSRVRRPRLRLSLAAALPSK